MVGAPDIKKKVKKKISTIVSISSSKQILVEQRDTDGSQGDYLAGLWEADGHIYIPKKMYSTGGSKQRPLFCITFSIREKPFVVLLQSILGGYIRVKSKENAQVLMIGKKQDQINIQHLINGKLKTPKEYQFKAQIKWMNSQNLKVEKQIKYKGKSKISLNNTAWLSGFIDGDGSFDIRCIKDPKKRIEIRFRQEQRMEVKGKSYEPIQKEICSTFKLNLSHSKHKDKKYFIISATSPKNQILQEKYLEQYPLFTTKKQSFIFWVKSLNMVRSKQHLTSEGFNKITEYKSQINRGLILKEARADKDWYHLKFFYITNFL